MPKTCTMSHRGPARRDQVSSARVSLSVRDVSYDEPGGDWGLQCISQLMGVLSDTATPAPDVLQSLADALLAPSVAIARARCRRGAPSDAFGGVVSPRLPAVEAGGAKAAAVHAHSIWVETSWAHGACAHGMHGGRVDMIRKLFESRVAFAVIVAEEFAACARQ